MISGFPRVGRICIGALVSLSVAALGNVPGRRSDAQGRLIRSTQTGQPATLVAYNELGEQVAQAQDLNGNGVIDYVGPDRVVSNDVAYVQTGGDWWQESRSYAFPETAAKLVATRRARLTGLGATSDLGALASEQVSLDLLGNETVRRTWVDRSAKKVSQTADAPDSTLDAVQTAVNGLVLTNATATGVVTVYGYDDLGRQLSAATVSDGGARSVGQTLVYNALGQVASVTDAAGNATAFAYDAAGRQSAVTNALGQVTQTAYDAEGRVLATWGATYPVAYEYDHHGRMTAMATTRDPAHESLDLWTLVPAGQTLSDLGPLTSDLDVTKWQYDLATGLVTNKVYADGKGTAYAYTADGKLARRTWARGVTTDYGYTPAGELETVNYSDATPDVTYAHDRLGRPVTIADVTGTRTNVYDVATLALAQEKLANGITLIRSQDVLGRPSGLSMPDYLVEYGYDSFGRFGSVTSSVTSVVNYSYVPGSDLLAGYTQGNLTREVTYETNRDLVDTVENKYGTTTVSKFDYTNDTLGRRVNREDTGSAFASAQENVFGYNLRSEVTGAEMRNGNSSYTYDPIGNRTTVTLPEEQNPLVYAANPLNQYTSITGRTAPAYDFDGNMLDDGAGLGMAWDGENRLIQTVKNGQTVTYAYDFMSRRVSKTVGGTTHSYVYDGWNLLSETDGTTVKRYVWGLDLSQTLQGAGGVGGLLAVSVAGGGDPGLLAPTCDANGNISEYIVLATGIIASHREYDAFGRVILSIGSTPSAFGFSTKYTDAETGLMYYGYRYYSAEMGRWVSRDPAEERGGPNLLTHLQNKAILAVDAFGLEIYYLPGSGGPAVKLRPGDPNPIRPGQRMPETPKGGWSWWDVLPFVGTVRNAFVPVPGDSPSDYRFLLSVAECECGRGSGDEAALIRALAEHRCVSFITAQESDYFAQSGIPTSLRDAVQTLGSILLRSGEKSVPKIAWGNALLVDSIVDIAVTYTIKKNRIESAAWGIKQFCNCSYIYEGTLPTFIQNEGGVP